MSISEKILELIVAEQSRQSGAFVPDTADYLEKLAHKAELLSHESGGQCLGFVFFYCNDPAKQVRVTV